MPSASHVGRTKLDKERLKLCQYEVESVCQSAQELKGSTKDDTHIKDNLKAANALLQRLLNIAIEVSVFPYPFKKQVFNDFPNSHRLSFLALRWVHFPFICKKRWKQALDQLPNSHKGCARWPWLLRESSKCWLCPLGLVSVRSGTVWKWALCMLTTSWEVSISCIGVWKVFRQAEICTERRHVNPNQVVGSLVRVHLKFKPKYCGAKK